MSKRPTHLFTASVKIEMLPVINDETTKERMLRAQAQARLDAFANGVARKLERMLTEDESACHTVDRLDKAWKKLTKRGAIRFVEF